MASFLSDRIVDEILESLSGSQNTLADHLIRKGQPLLHHDVHMETEVLDETVLQQENHQKAQKRDKEQKYGPDEMQSLTMTPKSKRKSILVRMLRPVSVAFEMEFDLDKALEEVPIHYEDPPLPSPPPLHTSDRMSYFGEFPPTPTDTNSVSLGELPPVEHKPLENCTKFRPKPKRRKPSRSPRQATGLSVPQDAEQNGMMGKLDEGVDDFFTKKVTKLSFNFPFARSPSTITPESTDKKRESRKSGFFNYIKSRASRSEKTTGAPSISPPHPSPTASSTVNPIHEISSPSSPTLPVKTPVTPVAESHPELHRAHSSDHTNLEREAPLTAPKPVEEEKEEKTLELGDHLEKAEHAEKKENVEKKETPHVHRYIGVPMMGKDLLAEMKARQNRTKQEKITVKKADSSPGTDKVDTDKPTSDDRPTVKVDLHPTSKLDLHPTIKSDIHPTVKLEVDSTSKVDLHPTSKVDLHPTFKVDLHPTSKVDLHPTSKVDLHPTFKVDLHPTSKVDLHPSSKVVHPTVKSEVDLTTKVDVHPVVPVDTEHCKPEPIPRSRPPSVTQKQSPTQATKSPLVPRTSGSLSPLRQRPFSISVLDDSVDIQVGSPSPKAPLPAPRLKRAQSEQDRGSVSSSSSGPLSPLDAVFPADGDAFDQPVTELEPGSGSRQWSSLKRSSSPPSVKEDAHERAKSLPTYVRLPSQMEADLSPAEGEIPTVTSDLNPNNKFEDESGDDPPSM